MLNIEKAHKILNWSPAYTAETAIEKTADWYKHFYQKDVDMFDYTIKQIKEYEGCAKWMKQLI